MAAGVAGSATTVAVLPLVVMAVFAVGMGIGLNVVDRHYGVKDKVIAALKMLPEHTAQGMYYIDTKSRSWQSELSDAITQKKTQMGRAIDQGVRDWLCRISCVRY